MRTAIQSDIYDYNLFLENISNDGTPVEKDLVIQADADFECQSLQACILLSTTTILENSVAAGEHFPGLYVDIVNSGNGQKWTDKPVALTTIFGTGQNPFVLPVSYIMERNAAFNISLINLSDFNIARVTFTFSGRKLLP